ncbi:DUF4328 domain-containing protein [Actinokineospora fastidiosa]|uniref:DUF4328 domain-containing protein n=1 Tax=Actinokineospora fastidiosa TaxID=1816 RepID=A0A918G408_9PSEU|nr:DUF4328 domain-containing protein [Actinokineospora fastidiosa]GGS18409.1 hypothetical protein GCM10010171_08680 [Actinokineospora fastidiosa]
MRRPLPPLRWEATPPPGAYPVPRPPRRVRYLGPPAYRSAPRWGFPALAWRRPTLIPGVGDAPSPPVRVRTRATLAMTALWTLGLLSLLAAGAEVFRYALLVRARTSALDRDTVVLSDTLVVTSATLAVICGLWAVATTLWWAFAARRAAGEQAGYLPARPDWQLLPSLVVPGVNLAVAGAVMAELEHAALSRPAGDRPRPTPLLRAWWIVLTLSGVLFAAAILWRFRSGVQAQADGVLLTAASDLAAAATAVMTALVVARLTGLLVPVDPAAVPRLRLIRVAGAPDPGRRERPATARR